MKLTGDWLTAVSTQTVFEALTREGHEAFAVGGCVRNSLMNVPVTDVDIATNAKPEMVIELARKAGLKAVPTGIEHGTVTLVSGGVGYEVTTYRADVETDGRHAKVQFSGSMSEDSARRDFTMNALYCDATGTVSDPQNGLPDLQARRVRFIGQAETRLKEDYLRALRFFRFAAWYADPVLGFDTEALAAIAISLDGLTRLSRERIGAEVKKLLSAPDPAPSVAAMQHTGVLHTILPGSSDRALAPLVHWEQETGIAADPIRRLASLGEVDGVSLRLSRKEAARLSLYRNLMASSETAGELGYRHGEAAAQDVLLLRAAMFEQPFDAAVLIEARRGSNAKLPVKPSHLLPEYSGAALGRKLKEIEARWIKSDFSLSKTDLLD